MKIHYFLLLILITVYLVDSVPTESKTNSEDKKARKNEKRKDRKNMKANDSIQSVPTEGNTNSEDKKARKNEKRKDRANKKAIDKEVDEAKQVKQFEKQVKSLFKLGCKPIKSKVAVRTLLSPKSDILDLEHVYPEFVVIKKCNQLCSFCKIPGDKNGIESELCISSKEKTKKIIVKFRNNESMWKYKPVKITEDKKCECVSKDYITSEIPPEELNVKR